MTDTKIEIDTALQSCAVLGAAGKMGRGIALLLLQEMAQSESLQQGGTGTGSWQLILIDSCLAALAPLRRYLRAQLKRYAEKRIVFLRRAYAGNQTLISNSEIIDAFVEGALDNVSCSTELAAASPATLIFEALPEDIPLKCNALAALRAHASQPQYYFSNTSSIPIALLNGRAELNGSLVGLHFYNPPSIQKVVELVILENSDPVAIEYAYELIKRFNKVAVHSLDLPGFIGNGYLMREIAFACLMVEELQPLCGLSGSIYAIDWLTRTWLLRPMGIFQLIDYIGVDICAQIAGTMSSLLQDYKILPALVMQMAARGIKGGQGEQEGQNPGFFKYQGGLPEAVYDTEKGKYVSLEEKGIQKILEMLQPLPKPHYTWKQLIKEKENAMTLAEYFRAMSAMEGLGAALANTYLQTCRLIAEALIESGVAQNEQEIETVMKMGFHLLYSPLAPWIPLPASTKEA